MSAPRPSLCTFGLGLGLALVCSAPVLAEAPLAIKKDAKGDQKKNEARARAVVNGYYQALIKGDYDLAGTFVHPDTIEPVRASLVAEIKKARGPQQKATLRALAVQDLAALENLPASKFFAHFARSQYGKALQVLAVPELKASAEIKRVGCDPKAPWCDVEVVVYNRPDGEPVRETPNVVRAALTGGRWLVGKDRPRGARMPKR